MKSQSAFRYLWVGAAAVLLTIWCAAPAPCQEERLGVVDMRRVIDESKQGKKSMEEMTDELRSARKDLEKRQAELVKAKDDIEKNAMTLPAEELAKMERQYQDMLTEYQRRVEDYQKRLAEKNREISDEMMKLAEEVVNTIGVRGYVVILETTSSGVLYYTDDVDLTGEVIELLNKK